MASSFSLIQSTATSLVLTTTVYSGASSATTLPSASQLQMPIILPTVITAAVVSTLTILALIIILAITITICVIHNKANARASSGIEMVGHVGRYSRDSLDFQSHTSK